MFKISRRWYLIKKSMRVKFALCAFFVIIFLQMNIMSMQDKKTSEFEDECAICTVNYTNPKTLLCGHKFCSDCILDWQKRSEKQECPMCRREIHYITDTQCGICKVCLRETDQIAKLKCNYEHVFHKQCLKNRLLLDYKNNDCSICNQKFSITQYFPEFLQLNNINESERLKDVEDVKEEMPKVVKQQILNKTVNNPKNLSEQKNIEEKNDFPKSKKVQTKYHRLDLWAQEKSKSQNLFKIEFAPTTKNKTLNILKFVSCDISITFCLGLIVNRVIHAKNMSTFEKPIALGTLGIMFAKYTDKVNAKLIERKRYPKLTLSASAFGFTLGYNITKLM